MSVTEESLVRNTNFDGAPVRRDTLKSAIAVAELHGYQLCVNAYGDTAFLFKGPPDESIIVESFSIDKGDWLMINWSGCAQKMSDEFVQTTWD
jgi:hypothetical protein